MSNKAMNKGMIAVTLASLMLIFSVYLAVYPAVAQAAKVGAVDKVEKEVKIEEPKELKAAEPKGVNNDKLLKLAMEMKLAEKDLEALMKGEDNKRRFFDPEVTKGMVDEDLLERLSLFQVGLLDDFDRNKVEPVEKVEEDAEPEELAEVEPVEVEVLEDEELMKIALNMKAMAKDMEEFFKNDDSSWTAFFDPVVNRGLIDRPLLSRLALLRLGLLNDFNARFVRADPFPRVFFGERRFIPERGFIGARPFFGEGREFDD